MALKHLITCVVAGIDYLVHPQILGSVQETVRADQIIPVLVLSEQELESGPEQLGKILQYYVDNDDVCEDEFTGILVVNPSSSGPDFAATADDVDLPGPDLSRFSAVYYIVPEAAVLEGENRLSSGPYFLSGPNLHQAWRLYPDELEAFTFGLIPDDPFSPQSFQAVASQSSGGLAKTIPVPSRHYHRATLEKPLAGTRVSLKDTFDIEGVRTALSSRAWAEMYPAAAENGPYVKHLLDQGAIIVGKTKSTQLLAGNEWIEFQSPSNPRGDQYQEPSGSSTGAAASLAGYPWLDYAVGGDSEGGVREPATYHGLHALRPTFGTSSLDGIKVISPRYDTVGIFARSLPELTFMAAHSFDITRSDVHKPLSTRILYPTDFFPLADPEQQVLYESFIEILEASLGVKRIEVDLAQLWIDKPPSQSHAAGLPLQEYMNRAPFWSLCYDFYQSMKHFRSGYHDRFGREPFLESASRLRWKIGANITEDDRNEYLNQIAVFRRWFDDNVVSAHDGRDQETILVLPYGDSRPAYRDIPRDEPSPLEGINPTLLSSILGTPHLLVPFAQLPYESHISGRTEYRPICVSVMGTRGSDSTLLRLVEEALRSAHWRTKVETGRYTFPLGGNSRNVEDQEVDGHDSHGALMTVQGTAGLVYESVDEL
ncbi:hypothetical protein N0V93_000663 [Gnomoniopsis smithogilvyi]|uniref:Amidase domain-containing protein n=1 Tax=Gnomoniopsis smithogilvyi TaxID=1191159 RepID=A0A9W8Z0K9_9PEZI|nr:hypothetical protein N0V93_000663 [Gnomoniopsis smithogilvyi]